MINGSMIGGFLIAVVLVVATLFVGNWFADAVAFSDAHSLDKARSTRPVSCNFKIQDVAEVITGTIHVRDGYMEFAIKDDKSGEISQWGVEIDMNDGTKMMTQSAPGEPFVSIESYPDLRVKVLEDLKRIIRSENLHCAPWWDGGSHRFALQGHI